MLAGFLAIPMLVLGVNAFMPIVSQPVYADGITDGANAGNTDDMADNLFGNDGIFTKILNMLLFLVGAISVLMLVYGGIRYTLSGGDSSAVTAAKNTILYAIIGIVVSLLAYAIVEFVLKQLI